MAFARFILIGSVSILLLYGLSTAASTAVYRTLGLNNRLDSGSLASDIFFGRQGASAVVYNRSPLIRNGPQILLVGASNMLRLASRDVAFELPGAFVSNMSVFGSDIDDFALAVDLAYQAIPPASRGQCTFVIGFWYGEFRSIRGQEPGALDAELLRYGLYRKAGRNQATPTLPRPAQSVAIAALRPFILERRAWETLKAVAMSGAMRVLGETPAPAFDTLTLDQVNLDEVKKRALLEPRPSGKTQVADEALEALTPIAKRISDAGDRLLLVDLPILPQWYAAAVAAAADYSRRKQIYFAALSRLPGVHYMDMQGSLTDKDFYYFVHVKPSAGVELARRLGRALAVLPTREGQAGAH